MDREHPIADFRIYPNYAWGFVFAWDVSGDFNDSGPWVFSVEEGPSPKGPWKCISPRIKNAVMWKEPERIGMGKANVLYFRLVLETPEGRYFSPPVQPYGTLSFREFMIAKNIMRREMIQARQMGGVECDVWLLSTFGPICTHCLDPVTGEVRDDHCPYCLGTGRDPGYYGPFHMMFRFSPDASHDKDNSQVGTHETKAFQATTTGNPALKTGDVIVDRRTDKRYHIARVAVTAEIRRVPCLQQVTFEEAPLSDVIHQLGKNKEVP